MAARLVLWTGQESSEGSSFRAFVVQGAFVPVSGDLECALGTSGGRYSSPGSHGRCRVRRSESTRLVWRQAACLVARRPTTDLLG